MSQSTYSKNDTWCQITKKKKKNRGEEIRHSIPVRAGLALYWVWL